MSESYTTTSITTLVKVHKPLITTLQREKQLTFAARYGTQSLVQWEKLLQTDNVIDGNPKKLWHS
ncbi:hypothetical protein E2C01_079655 [Portunus trituberculatus]|uniref:Uncharacterized protein n=1 Tax=Portunus trituberculatus TaxID=210409 RepID=A0A5B7IR62_PORTR|nr:hypothetical protein [Portunus trituberculatus]